MSMQGREVSQTVYGRVIWWCGVISLLFFFLFCARFAASRRWHRREVCLDLELFFQRKLKLVVVFQLSLLSVVGMAVSDRPRAHGHARCVHECMALSVRYTSLVYMNDFLSLCLPAFGFEFWLHSLSVCLLACVRLSQCLSIYLSLTSL